MVYQGSFQDIFFVLAGLAWVGYSAYRANKKKEQSSSNLPPKKRAEKSSLFEELLAQYTQGAEMKTTEDFILEKDLNVATNPRQTESSIELVEPFTDDDIDEKKESEKKLADESAWDEVEVHAKTNAAVKHKKQHSSRTFNLKKAFIYSEILNNKYI